MYELIQNAEDNGYSIANMASEAPSLSFSVCQDRIVIDSNEDGFSEANIRAICSIGESTKACIQGYIGEKGIGFKSVFKVAHKVHVQSGSYSFAFEYRRDGNDDGLGMVTPLNEEEGDVPEGVRTRITLYLLDNCDREALFKEFQDLPDTLLLFLKKLRRLSVHLESATGTVVETVYSSTSTGNRVKISKTIGSESSVLNFWTARRTISSMPHDEARKGIKEAEVILAFPMDHYDAPIAEEQPIFAFLPLRKVGYKVSYVYESLR